MASSDLISQISNRLPSGTGIYLHSGTKTTAGVMYYHVGPVTPKVPLFFEIHTGSTHVTSLQDFWKTHVAACQIENDLPTDQQLLERISISYEPVDAYYYPTGSSKTLAAIVAEPEGTWTTNQTRIDSFKSGAFERIYERLPFGTPVCYMEPGFPPLLLTLEKAHPDHDPYPGCIVFRASAEQPTGIELVSNSWHKRITTKFNHIRHVSSWYKKNVMGGSRSRALPLYNLYLTSGPYKGRNMGQLLDNSPWTAPAAKAEPTELFPIGSHKDTAVHVASIDYMLKKMEPLCRPCRVINAIKIMKYTIGHSEFVNNYHNFNTTVVAKARQFLKDHSDEPELVAQCQLVVQTYDLPNVVEVVVNSNSSSSSSPPVEPAAINEVVSGHSDNHVPQTSDEIIASLRRSIAELEQKNAALKANSMTLKAMLEASLKTL
jgi:hypothetical protein